VVGFFDSYYEFWVPFRKAVLADRVLTFSPDEQGYDLRSAGIDFKLTAWDQFPSDPSALYYLDEVGILAAVTARRAAALMAEDTELQALIRQYLKD
jgi:hypothetical protein